MRLFKNLFGKQYSNTDWEEIKKAGNVYPQNSISILRLKTESGKFGTGWVDKAYDKYPYKKFCPYNFLIKVDLTDNIAQKNQDLDMLTIEDFFRNELKKICVAHMVGRIVTDTGLNIEMYLEMQEQAMENLQTILDAPNRLVSFSCEVNEDPKWDAVSGLLKL